MNSFVNFCSHIPYNVITEMGYEMFFFFALCSRFIATRLLRPLKLKKKNSFFGLLATFQVFNSQVWLGCVDNIAKAVEQYDFKEYDI